MQDLALVCPTCGGSLDVARCSSCAWTLETVQGIHILLADPEAAEHDELDHNHSRHRSAQAAHFDRANDEAFEIHRPRGAPVFYRFLLEEKFRRTLEPIGDQITGASALSVCGGSGMDAEFLARAGLRVTSSDISIGAARRAAIRFQAQRLAARSVVADVERLPFADHSIDLVAVHDGLHHLDDPYSGLAEMARVARRWVVLTEPADAVITRLAIHLGLALDKEEAGNRVARLKEQEVARFLEAAGFRIVRSQRYAMYYKHHPGIAMRSLSMRGAYSVARLAWRLANSLLGRFGNKLVVTAERIESAPVERDSRMAH